ncbi:MAG: hypothetical protein ACRDWY_19065 [Actinomycetes bacterium]
MLGHMGTPHKDIHELVLDRIDGLLAEASVEDVAALELSTDRELLLAHWKTANQTVAADAPVASAACGKPQPCPHVLGFAEKFGLIG